VDSDREDKLIESDGYDMYARRQHRRGLLREQHIETLVWEIDSGECLAIHNIKALPFCILRLRNRLGKKERKEYCGNAGWDGYPQFLMTGFKDGSFITCKVSRSGQLEQIQRSKGSGLAYCFCELDTDTHYSNYDGNDKSNKEVHDDGRDLYHLIVNSPWLVPRFYVWNAMTGEQVRFVSHKTSTENNDTPITANSLEFTRVMTILKINRRSSLLATGLTRGSIKLWNNNDLIPIRSKNVNSHNDSDSINILNEKSKRVTIDPVRVLEGHQGSISKLIELSDGTLLSSSIDKTIRLWDTQTGECLWTANMEYEVEDMVLLSDGCSIAVVSGNFGRLEMFRMTWMRFYLTCIIAFNHFD